MLRNFEIDAVETDGDDQLRFRNWSDWDGAIELMHKTEEGAVNCIVLDKEQLLQLKKSVDIVLMIMEEDNGNTTQR
tara:strand:+ start:7038 stop:7265 length:228 start_codon:yes stop_codon:yes gene_type:complete